MNKEHIYDVAIIGGGPAGMMAAIQLGKSDKDTLIIEKNNELGNKLLLTGNGRCNFTTAKSINAIIKAFGKNGKFLYGPLSKFSNEMLINFFKTLGIDHKVERGERVFPKSESAVVVRNRLKQEIETIGVDIRYKSNVKEIVKDEQIFHLKLSTKQIIKTQNVLIATGGYSYPETGSTGQGHTIAQELGHTVTEIKPALTGIYVNNKMILDLVGLTLKNIELSFSKEGKVFSKSFGDMLFTHRGLSGPIVLEQSKVVYENQDKDSKITAHIDLKPALSRQQLKERITREIHGSPKKYVRNLLKRLLPQRMIQTCLKYTNIQSRILPADLTKTQKERIIDFLKDFTFGIGSVFPVKYAIITSGGVKIQEIDPQTMESKIVPGLYFAGEIIDLDGPTGGYNLQEAFTTGYIAGLNLSEK